MFRPTVDKILVGFTKTVAQLDALVSANNLQLTAYDSAILNLQDAYEELKTERDRAVTARIKIAGLLN